jgi:choline transporter-like protein 2/4/5
LGEDLLALELGGASMTDPSNLKNFYGVCVSKCPMVNDSSNPLYVHAYKDYSDKPTVVNDNSKSDKAIEDVAAGSPWRIVMDSTEILYRCVELKKISIQQKARCVDPCTAAEIDAYNNQTDPKKNNLNCGINELSNPLRDCKDQHCSDFILEIRPNCTNIEISREETSIGAARQDPVTEMLSRKWYMVSRWIGDIQKSAFPILICGGLFALILGFIWLIMLRFFAGLFVWLVVILVVIMQLVVTFFCAYEGNLLGENKLKETMENMGIADAARYSATISLYVNSAGFAASEDYTHYWAIACYVMIALDVLLLLLLIFMCSRIRIAIGIIRESSKALQKMPLLTLYPIVPTVFIIGLVAYWLVAAAYISTSADLTVNDIANTASEITGGPQVQFEVKSDKVVNYLLIYHLFGLLWTNEFIQATSYATIAGAFCEYYWTLDKRTMRSFPVIRSYWRTLRYHLGSIAFGSLIIAIVQMIRIALEYIDQKMRSTKQENTVIKVVMACLRCCMWCFEKCLKFLNKNAYIIMSMKGSSFCPSMKDSFSLLFANAARVATVSMISKFLMLLGKLFITAFSVFMMFLFIKYPPSSLPGFFLGDLKHVSSPIFPMLLTGLLGYAVASFFLDIYGTAIDTILLCFCEDCQVNKSSGTYYMSDELLAYIDGPAKKNAFSVYQPTRDESEKEKRPPIFSGASN